MADFLNGQNRHLTLIVVGGVISVLFLKNRNTTHDVDFFNGRLKDDDLRLLHDAVTHVHIHYQQIQKPLGGNQFNNSFATGILSLELHEQLTQEALQQDVDVFHYKGLKLLAASWSLSACCKLDQIEKRARDYDIRDAAYYIHHFIEKHKLTTVTLKQIQD